MPQFNAELREFLAREHAGIAAEIVASKDLAADTEARLRQAIETFKAQVWTTDEATT
jgi:F0F1-type ATP synthase alpha subunit